MLFKRRRALERSDLRAGLERVGVPRGGLVLLHSSLSSLGWVLGAEDAVVAAMLDALGPEGTLAVPAFTRCFAPGKGHPAGNQGPFDIERTPSSLGRISEAVRRRPDALRSHHPIHSVAACGPAAAELVQGHEAESDFGPESPFGKIIERNGSIVLLGVGQRVNSTLHAVEDLVGMPYLREAKAHVCRPDGRTGVFVCRKCPVGDRDFYRGEDSKWEAALRRAGVVRRERLGEAEVQIMEAGPFARAAAELLRRTPDLLLCDEPRCSFCVWAKGRLKAVGLSHAGPV